MLQTFLEPVPYDLREIGIDREARRDRKFREGITDLLKFEIAARGNFNSLIEDERDFSENAIHFLAVFEIKLIGVELHAIWIVDGLTGLDTEKQVVGPTIVLMHVMAIVAGNRADPRALRNLQHVGNDFALLFQSMIMDLQEETVFAENILVFRRGFFRLIHAPC